MKKILNTKNILNSLLVMLFLVLIFVPPAKALVLEGLMTIGFFKPDTEQKQDGQGNKQDLSGIVFRAGNGQVIALEALKGKVIFLNFWAAWCPPCLAEMPAINKLYEEFKADKQVVFILVDADGDLVKSQRFMDRKKYGMPVYAAAGNIPETLFGGSLPTTVVFDKDGRISYHETGAANYGSTKFINFINRLKSMK